MTENLLTTTQVAAQFGVHPSTVHRWIEQGRLAVAMEAGGYRLITQAEVDRFATSGKAKA